MQSKNYVPGVSGWKIEDSGRLELNDGNQRIIAEIKMVTTAGPGLTNDQAAESIKRAIADEALARRIDSVKTNLHQPKPFIVVDGVVYIRQAKVDDASIEAQKLTPEWTVKLELLNGKYVAAGIGLGVSDFETAKEQGFSSLSEYLASFIAGSALAEDLKAKISTMDLIKEAVAQGAILGYQAVLKDLGKTS